MGRALTVRTIDELNKLARQTTLHTLACVLDYPSFVLPEGYSSMKTDFYTVVFEKIEKDDTCHGCKCCDFRELSMTFHTPGQTIALKANPPLVRIIAFHADLFFGSKNGCRKPDYTFFHYTENEALHISLREKRTLWALLDNLFRELDYGIDIYSQQLLAAHINLILDYCSRFYRRQFYLRTDLNKELISHFDSWLDKYILKELPKKRHLPPHDKMAEMLDLSLPYFMDMMQVETGETLQEHIRIRLIEVAKQRVMNKDDFLGDIAAELGFPNLQSFNYLFRKLTGYTPKEYRENLN